MRRYSQRNNLTTLSEINITPLLDLAFVLLIIFMIARTPGLIAHVIEEQTRERPMRRIDPVNHGYDGPAPRSLTTNEHK